MRYSVCLIGLGVALIFLGSGQGIWGLAPAWLGADFAAVGIAYWGKHHRVFGKRADGRIPVWSKVLFLPLLALTYAVWHLARCLSREPACQLVNEKLFLGRRLLASEVPGRFSNYVDLTAELEEPARVRSLPGYLALPILDASAPSPEALRAALDRLAPGPTFVHCAQGHGRTGLFALALLLSSGAVRTPAEGMRLLKELRPGIRLSSDQWRCIEAFARANSLWALPEVPAKLANPSVAHAKPNVETPRGASPRRVTPLTEPTPPPRVLERSPNVPSE
jgi:protein-tyrosine phosphatase